MPKAWIRKKATHCPVASQLQGDLSGSSELSTWVEATSYKPLQILQSFISVAANGMGRAKVEGSITSTTLSKRHNNS